MEPTENYSSQGSVIKILIIGFVLCVIMLAVFAAFFSAQSRARDEIRVRDIALMQKFLEAYKMNQGIYPPAANGSPTDWRKYLEALPVAPPADGVCTKSQNAYSYDSHNSGGGYTLSFCLGHATNGFSAGLNIIGKN